MGISFLIFLSRLNSPRLAGAVPLVFSLTGQNLSLPMNFTRLLSAIKYKRIPTSTLRPYSTMSIEQKLQSVFSKVDELKPVFIERLANAVAIPSVSGDEALRKEVFKMSEFLVKELETLGAYDIQVKTLGKQPPPVVDENLELPPIVLARVGKDESKKTIMIYGHYDVQPALMEDGWDTFPFKLVEVNDKLYGRGSTDDKGPVIAWLNVLQAHKELSLELPVNIIFCFEGMEESGSLGLEELVGREADKYFKGVDTCCISDNYWLGTKKPVLTYGLRGCNYYQISVSGPGADLHSGIFGGVIHEPMTDLIKVMSQLVDVKGKILIPGIDEMVAPVTETEEKLYDDIEFDVDELNIASGSNTAIYQSKNDILMHRWRYPSLSLHGIEGAFSGGGAKTVIPAKVVGKFSIRTVPDIDSKKMDQYVFDYVNAKFKELGSPNTYKVELIHDGAYWKSDPFNDSFTAAKKATKVVWGVEPDLTREGGSIPITLTFEQQLKTNVLLLPLGKGDDGAHSINEKIDVKNYIEGAKTMAAYLHYYGEM